MPQIPDGFTIHELQIDDDLERSEMDFWAMYMNEDRPCTVELFWSTTPRDGTYEKDDHPVEIYEKDGITHYLFENNGFKVCAWYNSGFECHIQGDLTEKELLKMIDSIYEG